MPALNGSGLHLVERDAFFMPPRPRNQNVLDAFPEGLVLLEIDYRRCLAAFFVRDELHSGRECVSLWRGGIYIMPPHRVFLTLLSTPRGANPRASLSGWSDGHASAADCEWTQGAGKNHRLLI